MGLKFSKMETTRRGATTRASAAEQAMVTFGVGVLVAFWLGFLLAAMLAVSRRAERATDGVIADHASERDSDRSRSYMRTS